VARDALRRTAILDADPVGRLRPTAMPGAAWSEGKWRRRGVIAIAWAVLLAGAVHLSLAPRPQAAPAVEGLDRLRLEQRAAAALARWQREHGQSGGGQDEPGDGPTKANVQPADADDGLYAGVATLRSDDHVVTFKVRVTNGSGSGTESRPDCGTAPMALRISRSGEVSGMMLIFGSTCLKTELAIRGRAAGGTLRLRLGSQFVDLSKPDD